ncbi:MAG TPA: serine/threonine-protein kinase [Gemmatimonadaceae bacterium]|nr:serine/threonine-protein kinase [Gemmatimonadaceae bacterium]
MSSHPIAGRYEVIRPLGQGAFAQTLLARDQQGDRHVALKVLSLRDTAEWKTYELFEREAAVLRTLRHSGIPAMYDTFRAPWNDADSAWLAMEYIEGTTLAQCIAESRAMDPAAIRRLFMEVLGVLEYLHSRLPPILHRDIKPANIILRPDGAIALVDFGSVRHVVRRPDEAGSTVAGTYGYMPYEQYMGRASPASDLYSAAATLLHLITGRAPSDWMAEDGRVQVPDQVTCGEPLRSILVRLLAPSPADRFQSARETIDAMLGGAALAAARAGVAVRDSRPPVPRHRPAPPALLGFGAAPRRIEGETAALLRKLTYSQWQLIAGNRDPNWRPGVADMAVVAFFSIITAGILPLVTWSFARTRKRQIQEYLMDGTPAIARILDMEKESTAFDMKMMRVRYEFEADGAVHRGVDSVLRPIAERWDSGDSIHILYLPHRDYASAIVSTS